MDSGARLGHYEILETLGSGGMGAVYLARDQRLQRQVAVKVLRDSESDSGDSSDTLLAEARMASALKHPHICAVYDIDLDATPPFIAMEYVDGRSLDRLIARRQVSLADAARYGAEIADALAHAHTNGVIHRDLKPGNVIVDADGGVKVLDFGLATGPAAVDPEEQTARAEPAARQGQPGTLPYMAPETLRGKEATARSDIWSFGVMLYEMVAGRRPFNGDTAFDISTAIVRGVVPPLPDDVPQGVTRIISRCLETDPQRRYGSAGEVRAGLEIVATAGLADPAPTVGAERAEAVRPTDAAAGSNTPERRRVTMLLCACDVGVAGTGGAPIDPEDRAAALLEFARLCTEMADSYGGAVLPAVGQRVVVSFGYPRSFEDAAQRALHTGLAIQTACAEREAAGSDAFVMRPRFVADTGVVLAGGEDTLQVVGEPLDAVERISAHMTGTAIVATSATARAVEGFFETEPSDFEVPGWQRGPLHDVRRATGAHRRIDVGGDGLSPLVGRAQEVALLQQHWERTCDGMSTVVHLVGEAGIGKSRLVGMMRALVQGQAEENEGLSIAEWNCSPYHRTNSLHPAVEYLSRMLAFDQVTDPAERWSALAGLCDELELESADAVAYLGALLSLPPNEQHPVPEVSPRKQKDGTLDALVDWVYALAGRGAMLFVVEDLHWADPSTLEFLSLLMEEGPAEPTLLLLTARPGGAPNWPRSTHHSQINLARLTSSQIVRLVRRLTGREQLPRGVIEWMVSRTDGVPLFVEEITKLVEESGALDELRESSASTGSIPIHEVPETLRDLLVARLDRVGGNRDLIQIAAAIGREFSYELLLAASGMDPDVLDADLETLVDAELLYRKGRGARRRYIFKHALLQDAATESVLKARRREMHASIYEALMREFPETAENQPDVLAQHCALAGKIDEAIGYWLAAGTRAAESAALEEAISAFHSGLELVATLPEGTERDGQELGFQIQLAVATLYARGYASPEFGQVQERARELCEALEHPALYYVVWGIHAWRLVRAEYVRAEKLGLELEALADAAPDAGFVIEACHNRATPALYQGDYETCARYSEDGWAAYVPEVSAAHAQHTGQNSGVTNLNYWALGAWFAGRVDTGVARAREAQALADELGQPFSIAYANHHSGWLYFNARMADEAEAAGRRAVATAEEFGLGLWDGTGRLYAASGLLVAGEHEEALTLATEGLAIYQATGASLGTSLYQCMIAEALAGLGRHDAAAEHVAAGLEFAAAHDEGFHLAEANRLAGEIELQRSGPSPACEKYLREALRVARRQSALPFALRAALSLVRMTEASGGRHDGAARRAPRDPRPLHGRAGLGRSDRRPGSARQLGALAAVSVTRQSGRSLASRASNSAGSGRWSTSHHASCSWSALYEAPPVATAMVRAPTARPQSMSRGVSPIT